MKKIAIHSVPRSGSSWLGEIINSSEHVHYAFQPLFSYSLKSALNDRSPLKDIDDFYNNILISKDEFIGQHHERKAGTKPNFKKTDASHIAYKEVRYHYVIENLIKQDPQQKVIGLVRNPLSVLSSWKNAKREFRADLGWDFNNEWKYAELKNQEKKEEYFGYEKWKETALLFKHLSEKYPSNFHLINYNDLLLNTFKEVEDLFQFLELRLTSQTIDFLNESEREEVMGTYSVFRKKSNNNDDSWKKHIPKPIELAIRQDVKISNLSEFVDHK